MHRASDVEPPATFLEPQSVDAFSESARRAVYDVIALRRDVRHFRPDDAVDDATLERILGAAHLAPSVGFSQPWGFVVVRDVAVRERIRESFLKCREAEAARFPVERREAYLKHKLEGILEAPVNVCVAVDLRPQGEAVLGTTAQPEAVRASACCAVQNLWLAARAEGLGVGWVSIVEPAVLRRELELPPGVEPVAYLCVGRPVAFRDRPMLEETGWRPRRPVEDAIHRSGRWRDAVESKPAVAIDVSKETAAGTPPRANAADERARGAESRAAARAYEARLAKPVGSLGRLEDLAIWYAGVRGAFPPPAPRKAVLALFAADHGVAVEGVSAYGSQVTAQVVANIMAGGAAINAVAVESGVEILLVDVGVAGDLRGAPTQPVVVLRREAFRAGTGNLRREPALSASEVERALRVGESVARDIAGSGADVIALGEIGIGNTTAAAALIAAFTGLPARDIVGSGTGVGAAVRARKMLVVEEALALHRPSPDRPIAALAAVGGLEIAALAGCAMEAAKRGLPVVLDGVVTNAAALAASALVPGVERAFLASHRSPEPGAAAALARLGLEPLLDLGLRLGEGTGAALGAKLLMTAVAVEHGMATFETAGIVGRAGVRRTQAG